MWWVILLTSMAFNLPHRPWEFGRWWNVITGAAVSYCARASFTSPVLSVLYEHICRGIGATPDVNQEVVLLV